MNYKAKKVFLIILFALIFCIGLLFIYRLQLKPSDMAIITGKVANKTIAYRDLVRSGRVYCLSFKLEGRQDKIAIRLNEGSYVEAEKDSSVALIDTGKTYTFYLDPTISTSHGDNWGIDKIDYNGAQVFSASQTFNLYSGAFLCLLSVIAFIIMLKVPQKRTAR